MHDYANCLCRLVHNGHQRKLMSEAAQEVNYKFDIDTIGNNWITLFEKLYEDNIHNKSCQSSSDTPGR